MGYAVESITFLKLLALNNQQYGFQAVSVDCQYRYTDIMNGHALSKNCNPGEQVLKFSAPEC